MGSKTGDFTARYRSLEMFRVVFWDILPCKMMNIILAAVRT
jgi:hypothetical protein